MKRIKLRKKKITVVIYRGLMIATALVMIASIVLFLLDEVKSVGDAIGQILLCIAAMICLSIPIFLEKRYKIFIPNYISIMLFLFVFSHFILGEIYRVYDHSAVFDKILHTTSGIIIAMLSYSIVSILNEMPKTKTKLSPFFLSLFAFCFTMTIEYLWELLEYLIDTLANSNMQRWQDSLIDRNIPSVNETGEYLHSDPRGSGLKDTMMDMLVNIFGALGVSVYGYIGMKLSPESWFLDKVILTDSDIGAMKETAPEIEVDRARPQKKRHALPLRRVRGRWDSHIILAQKAARAALVSSEEKRAAILKAQNAQQKSKTRPKSR